MHAGLFSAFRRHFPADLSKAFIVRHDGRVLSYQDMLDLSGKLANVFKSAGLRAGDRVAAHVDKSPEALMIYLAALRSGAIYLPLNSAYTLAELEHFLQDAQPALYIGRPQDISPELQSLAQRVGVTATYTLDADGQGSLIEAMHLAATSFDDVDCGRDDVAAILYTSGTTGRSKGAMLTHGNLESNSTALKQVWRFHPEDRLLHALPIFHTHGLFVATNIVLMTGCSMIFLPQFNVGEIIRALPQATVMMGVPTFYTRLLGEEKFTRALVSHIRLFVSGSAPLSAETHREFQARAGHAILERFGMTETNMNTSNPYEEEGRIAGSVGLALPGVEVRITDPQTSRSIVEQTGMIEIRGPNVFKGYWKMPEKTKEDFREDGFFISGDLGYIDSKGYVYIVGRAKDLIISGGYNVYPAEVEAVIEEVAGVSECAVIGAPHPDFGEGVIAVVTPKPGVVLEETAIRRAAESKLAKYKQPKRIFVVPSLPRNAMGKVQKKELRAQFSDAFTNLN